MGRIVKYALLAVSLLLTGVYLALDSRYVGKLWYSVGSTYFILIVMTLLLTLVLFRKRLAFFEVLQHEGTHLLFALASFRRINGLYVSATHGMVDVYGNRKDSLITLAPYFFPLLSILLILIFSLIEFRFSRHLVVASYCWYLAMMIKNLLRGNVEILSHGVAGILKVVVLNFWISQYVLSWCLQMEFSISNILNTIFHGIA